MTAHPSPFDPGVKLVLLGSGSSFIQEATKATLEDEGILVITASTIPELVEIVPMFPFTAIILDVGMTGPDDLMISGKIWKAGGECVRTPVICVSKNASHSATEICRRHGMKLLALNDAGFKPLIDFLACLQPPVFEESAPCR